MARDERKEFQKELALQGPGYGLLVYDGGTPVAWCQFGPAEGFPRYVAIIGDCITCHGPDLTGMPPSQLAPDGYPNPRPMAATWTLEQFVQTMRTGVRPTGLALDMPWENASQMDDQDLAALYAFLTAEP
jgi:cytochrome c553